ncbi:T9SS type A sorting domain-containing protein [Paracrocinitomix mangrovi]|uniref:T9SS type A sorting domain-containing protein n=1 Tax=Paracrocinitomix mangrovi TaxID=2862509 RepID=UPI001C8EF474|nr:T9SS type A sorting domain-containing protein [Paracrocinitomix mangrovi]UKN01352.1 T9SS type A sorting domain-containing protein [Paracrocinitomix mangrovi]
MKRLAIALCMFTGVSFAQVKTTTQDGAFWNPFVWDCTCLPADGDSLVINHNLSLSTGIAYTSGQIKISANGQLSDGANMLSFYINGGSLINEGYLEIDDLLMDAGFIENHGTAVMDSVFTRSTTINSGSLTTSSFAHDEGSTFTNAGTITVNEDFNNQGDFINNGLMTVNNNATNCNIQTMDAIYTNNGILCIMNDFSNCGGDTLRGSGTIYIDGNSSNLGDVIGSLTINTPSGSFNLNTGTIGMGVTFGTASCGVGEKELDGKSNEIVIYPNPANDFIKTNQNNFNYSIVDLSGRKILAGYTVDGSIDIHSLATGNYILQMFSSDGNSVSSKFVKQ